MTSWQTTKIFFFQKKSKNQKNQSRTKLAANAVRFVSDKSQFTCPVRLELTALGFGNPRSTNWTKGIFFIFYIGFSKGDSSKRPICKSSNTYLQLPLQSWCLASSKTSTVRNTPARQIRSFVTARFSGWQDLNLWPPVPKTGTLPNWATSRL